MESIAEQACLFAEVCAFKLRLLEHPNSDINKAWTNMKHRAQCILSSSFHSDEERSAFHSQVEDMCNLFVNAMSKFISGRLCNLMGFAQNIKAVIVITDHMNMLEHQAAEIYMRTTGQLPHDSFTPEFMDVTEQLRGFMREVIANPYQHSSDETVELVHTLAVWQAEHFLSHFNPDAFNMSDVFGILRTGGLGLVPADIMECYSYLSHEIPGPNDKNDSSSGEEKVDISEKGLDHSSNDNGSYDKQDEHLAQQLTNDQTGMSEHVQPPLLADGQGAIHMSQAGSDKDADKYAELSVLSTAFSRQPTTRTTKMPVLVEVDSMPTSSFSRSGLLGDQSNRIAVVRPQIHCDGVVDGLALEEWETLVSSIDITDEESVSAIQERLVAAVYDQTASVTCLQDEITVLREAVSSGSSGSDGTYREKQRRLLVAEMWVQHLSSLRENVRRLCEKSKLIYLRDLGNSVLEDSIRQTLGCSGGSLDRISPLMSAVSDLIREADILSVLWNGNKR
jgi:hypothetical protein